MPQQLRASTALAPAPQFSSQYLLELQLQEGSQRLQLLQVPALTCVELVQTHIYMHNWNKVNSIEKRKNIVAIQLVTVQYWKQLKC